MADVTRRDAMSISSLLVGPSPASQDGSDPNTTTQSGSTAALAGASGLSSILGDVTLPNDPEAKACAELLAGRINAVQNADSAAEVRRLSERLNKSASRARDEADVFVAYAYPSLIERAEARVGSKRVTVSAAADDDHSSGSAVAGSGRKRKRDDFLVITEEPRKSARSRRPPRDKGAKLEPKLENDFVPIAPAASSAAQSTPTSKRRRGGGGGGAAAAAATAAAAAASGADDSITTTTGSKRRSKKQPPVTPEPDASSASEAEVPTKKQALAAQRRERQYTNTYEGIWRDIARKDIPKAYKFYGIGNSVKLSNCRKTATLAAKEARKWQLNTNRHVKDMQTKARRAMREMLGFWKRNEKEERDSRKRAEKEALDSARRQEEERESRRQARKLNFLITQTELYSHFVGSKEKAEDDEDSLDSKGSVPPDDAKAPALDFDAADDSDLQRAAAANAQKAVATARSRAQAFDRPKETSTDDDFQNPTSLGSETIAQPKLLSCQLKEYQLKGLTWLANLYEQGINGILADEMGLGKTVQSISVMAYLAEVHDIWGPFLVVAPASTLHNWQQEVSKFVPEFKVLPYWGSNKDRKVLRKFWDRKQLRYSRDSPFHVLVTSYQLVVADAQYFNRIKWQYMILDEAQAIKSSSSSRWKSLLGLQCRNRLLLTGTPIQNSMQELWALLHFIMPTLFDSHEEFSDWFSKDIESHATKNSQLNEAQLKRLHMILKPFMLRRIKRHVQQELGEKIELDLYCNLTPRQKILYRLVKSQISIRDLIEKGSSGDDAASLMNLVMQFRKVCNHPDLFERQDVISAFSFATFGHTVDVARESNLSVAATSRNCIELDLPKLFVNESGILNVPGHHSNQALRNRVLRNLSVVDVANPYVKSVSKFSGTPAGEIVRLARQGLYERAVDSAPELLKIVPQVPITGVFENFIDENYVNAIEPAFHDRATAPPVSLFLPDRSFYMNQELELRPPASEALFPLTLNEEWRRNVAGIPAGPGYYPDNGKAGFSTISVPSMPKFIADSGKLKKLDELLVQLKRDDHRVLIYFQMTRMMDLMEEYLTFRQYKYVRLDGSSKLGDRRDLVNDWQTRPELFVFLLSTRAGGLGINLTAADTVIFYDSDWNPTIDSQAMDRAHRLGQTRQVTVYRLLVRGTIEERMRNRAKQKEQVQAVVMEGSKAAVQDTADKSGAPQGKDVAYWLLDEDENK